MTHARPAHQPARRAARPRRAAPLATLGVALAVSGAAPAAAQRAPAPASSREPYPGLDAYVSAALATWKVPGLALALVRHDSVIYARGYGVRALGRPEPVDARTIFGIGSSSKAFTAAAVAMLVDDKKVSLDAPAATYLPTFQLFDPVASREITVRDLLSHRSGLARGELVWYGSGYDRDEILRHVRYLQPSWTFRSQFGYQNIMYVAAGQVAAHAAGASWDEFVATRIFAPLGMTSSSTTIRGLERQPDVATPHGEVDDTVRVATRRNFDNIGPAGSINSNAVDMAQWVRLQLGGGAYGGRQLISRRMVTEMHTPQILVPLDTAAKRINPETHFSTYGLGWFVEDYRGHEVWHHGGNVDGFTALVGMLPDEQLGVVVLTNMNGSGLPMALMRRVFDAQLGAPARDWSGVMHTRTEELMARAKKARQALEARRVPNTRPSLPLPAYAGTYVDSLYGAVTVREAGGKLSLEYGPSWRGDLQHWHFDVFRTRFDTPVLAPFFVEFRPDAAAKVDAVQFEIAGVPMTFRRRPVARPRYWPTAATSPRSPRAATASPSSRIARCGWRRSTGPRRPRGSWPRAAGRGSCSGRPTARGWRSSRGGGTTRSSASSRATRPRSCGSPRRPRATARRAGRPTAAAWRSCAAPRRPRRRIRSS